MTAENVKNNRTLSANPVSAPDAPQLSWQFAENASDSQKRLQNLDWLRPHTIDHAELIKENAQRQVWRLLFEGNEYYAKLYFRTGRRWKLKRKLRGPDCLKEWLVAQYAAKNGIDCVKPVACALRSCPEGRLDSILITAGIQQSLPLNDYWEKITENNPENRRAKTAALENALARLLARAHHAGFAHSDLHPGNLLVHPLDADRLAVSFVDLHSIRVGKTVSQSEAVRNLAQINQWFRKNAPLTQRMRFLKRYMHCRKQLDHKNGQHWSEQTFKNWARDLDLAALRHADNLFASRDRRIMRKSKYFDHCSLPDHWQAHFFLKTRHPKPYAAASAMEFSAKEWKNALKNPLALMDEFCRRTLPIKRSRAARVCRGSLQLGEKTVPVVAKSRTRKKFLALIWDCFRPSRAIRAWKISHAMIHRDIPVAFPLAVLERRLGPVLTDSLFISEDIAPAIHLMACLTNTLPAVPEPQRRILKNALSDQLAAVLKKMHRNGFLHRDLKATNILVKNMPFVYDAALDPAAIRVVLVDADSVVKKRELSEKHQLRALARLAKSVQLAPVVSNTDRARFLRTYLARLGSGRPDWKTLWRKIQSQK